MAFTGTPVVKQITDREVRITGISLAGAAAGTIGTALSSGSPGIKLPHAFQPNTYTNPEGVDTKLNESIDVTVKVADVSVASSIPFAVVKTGGLPTDFLATITNLGEIATGLLEIYVKFHD